MNLFDRIRYKSESERRRLFWFSLLGVGTVVFGLWALAFHASLKDITINQTHSDAIPPKSNEAREKFFSLGASLFERISSLGNALPFLKHTVPDREEIIK